MAESFTNAPLIQKQEVENPMPIDRDKLLSLWNLEDLPACDEGMILAQTFLEASGECVSNQGLGRTSSTRAGLLSAYNAMAKHTDACEKCNALSRTKHERYDNINVSVDDKRLSISMLGSDPAA